jgi:hypothetical protein
MKKSYLGLLTQEVYMTIVAVAVNLHARSSGDWRVENVTGFRAEVDAIDVL